MNERHRLEQLSCGPASEGGSSEAERSRVLTEVLATLRATEPHRSAIASFESAASDGRDFQPIGLAPLVIVPGAFAREYPAHGADGSRILSAAKTLGIEAYRIPLPSFCSVSTAAGLIRKWLDAWHGPPVILVALSKGAADVKRMILDAADDDAGTQADVAGKIRGLITISGIMTGTPLVNYAEQKPIFRTYLRIVFRLFGYRFADLADLRWSKEVSAAPAQRERAAPELTLPTLNIVGAPQESDLSSSLARRSYRRIANHGPSDGGGILIRDFLRYPGAVVPLCGKDHYMVDVATDDLLLRSLKVLSELSTCSGAVESEEIKHDGRSAELGR